MKPTPAMFASPYDGGGSPQAQPVLVQLQRRPVQRWVASRFNARTTGSDGRLILWNTLSGAISVFLPEHQEPVVRRLSPEGLATPSGDKLSEYLGRRGFLVRDGVDEMQLFRYKFGQQQWRSDILQFILLASEDCNFRCVYCYEKFERGTMSPETRQGVRALTMKRAPHLKEMSVSWFGGEPLYGWDAVQELSPFFKDVAEHHGISHHQAMTTNAYLLTEERATKLLEWGCRQYQITIDGLPEEHDCKRVGRDGSPTYHVILDNLRSLRDRRNETFNVNIRVNFDQNNVPRLGAFLEALSEDFAGDRRFSMRFRAVGKWGGSRDDELATCGVSEQRTVLHQLREKASEVDLVMEGGVRAMAAPGSQVCYAARPYNFIVGATGKLMKCTIALYDLEANMVGQLHPDGEIELNDERMSRWAAPQWETDSLCQSCYVLPGCQGAACPLTRITQNTRTCCGVKSSLKSEMRLTLAEAGSRIAVPDAEAVPV